MIIMSKSGLPRSETLVVDFSQKAYIIGRANAGNSHVLMQIVPPLVHRGIKSIAAASLRVTVKSMLLSATATCSEYSRAPPIFFCRLRRTAAASVAPRGVLVESTGVALSRGLCQLKRTNRLLHTALTCNLHVVSQTYVQSLTPQAVRGSRSLMAAASLQVSPAASAQQPEDVKDRTSHQNQNPLDSILLQADSAAQPFLASPAEQPARARVDYSKSQRPLQIVDPEVEMINPADWDVVCDVRTPDEFEEDRIIGAINTPVLSNQQRAEVGTMYKQIGQHEAKRLGAALISQNIASIMLEHFQTQGKQLRVLVYCWRGGERSQSLAHVLSRVGWEVAIVKRGYMGYRNQVRRCMEVLGRFQYHVIGGATGSGKGKLLDTLTAQGAQVVDLEVAADHRGSILGDHPTRLQPPQKMFESKLLHQMRNFSVHRPVFIESESSLVGRRQVPNAMWKGMQTAAQVSELEVPLHCRVAWLRKNYSYFEDEHREVLMEKLDALTRTSGKKLVAKWRELAEQSRWDEFVAAMLQEHYDTVYTRAQLKYLTPSTRQATEEDPATTSATTDSQSLEDSMPSRPHDITSDGHTDSTNQQDRSMSQEMAVQAGEGSANGNGAMAKHRDDSSGDETVAAAGALSHLFGGPRQKLMQQMSSKEAESTLRWHREPVADMSDETYVALAQKLLRQYDPVALA